jgi:hypothetical protein
MGTVKHLAPIDGSGETVIGRTVKMLRSMGAARVFVVTHRDEIVRCVGDHAQIIRPENREYLTESILSSRGAWTVRTVVLLGDVFFTQDCMQKILACGERLRFFGVDYHGDPARSRIKRSELYAFSFDASAHDFVEGRLRIHSGMARFRDEGRLRRSCIAMAAAGRLVFGRPRRSRIYGKLWGLYIDTMGIRLFDGDDYGRRADDNERLEVIDDMTQDIDVKEDYDALMEKLHVMRGVSGG